ncbi:hypothetical protein JQ561_31860 [Bradyrhizobium diazoefficiens]|uniref:hypothetical protein n=1 Tax=Bradyrhizobium sp. WYCCWR 12699 TaxID=3064203 RepID=UPI001BAD1FD1|nr:MULTISPECIES: hypothetical protein [Bradyrhizobium]MBR0931228.1 hypothetical protein [Bradyrhizobium diazoefficiens]MDT4742184.1 hypothetical protein [Bradyrhizobium sp. WYCCWR 12699]
MEASRRAAVTVKADHGSHVAEPIRTAIIETTASHRRIIARQRGSAPAALLRQLFPDVTMLRVDTVPAAMLGRTSTATRVTSCLRTASFPEHAVRAIGAGCCLC